MSNYFSMEAFDYDDISKAVVMQIPVSNSETEHLKYRLFLPIWKVSLMITLLFG